MGGSKRAHLPKDLAQDRSRFRAWRRRRKVGSRIPRPLWAEYRAMAEAETQRPVSYMGAALIVGIWIAAAALIALMVASWQFY